MSSDTGIGVAESGQSAPREAEPTYQSGFGNEFATEAIAGALPRGQTRRRGRRAACTPSSSRAPRSPRRAPRTGDPGCTASAPGDAQAVPPDRQGLMRTRRSTRPTPPPNRLRWDPLPYPEEPADFVDGLTTIATNGDASARHGIAFTSIAHQAR